MRKMISVDDARNLISAHCMGLGVERVELLAGLGGVLFDDVFSAIDMPGFAQSAMDGYALNWAGYGGSGALTVVGEMAAGASEGLPKPAPNQAIRIFTGAPLPEGLDTVVMQEKVVTWQEMLDMVRNEWGDEVVPIARKPHETVKQYRLSGGQGTFAVISTMSAPFCGDCNRMRLTADGKMKNCLFSKGETDLLGALRKGESLLPLIEDNIGQKAMALGGQFAGDLENIDAASIVNRSMITIGG